MMPKQIPATVFRINKKETCIIYSYTSLSSLWCEVPYLETENIIITTLLFQCNKNLV